MIRDQPGFTVNRPCCWGKERVTSGSIKKNEATKSSVARAISQSSGRRGRAGATSTTVAAPSSGVEGNPGSSGEWGDGSSTKVGLVHRAGKTDVALAQVCCPNGVCRGHVMAPCPALPGRASRVSSAGVSKPIRRKHLQVYGKTNAPPLSALTARVGKLG